ncbi:hypothetical protein [Reyranella sp.]|uniref:hypothetical protein n=1 Tax=Reyranella sp. TaxID=1929291 RepID=UPI002717B54B|nr:hypothetical protein [Reyranella sp.]MDO8976895.1 hypothetical protein [Reyranella sp.]
MEAARTLLGDIAQYFVGPADPRDQLDALDRDRRDAEAEIRAVLDRLASKYDVPSDDVDDGMPLTANKAAEMWASRPRRPCRWPAPSPKAPRR